MRDVTKLNLRLPAAMRDEAARLAEAMGLSLNAYILQAVLNANGYRAKQVVKYQRAAATVARVAPVQGVPKVGANQPCPCGSGQKYKRCHGKPQAA